MLQLNGMVKSFGHVRALADVDFALREREIHGLLGENGAGKTTLMNVLYGLYRADGGEILLDGTAVEIASPRDAIAHGIGMVHQKFLQVDSYSVTENVVLGTPVGRRGLGIDLESAEERVAELAQRFGLEVAPRARTEELPVGTRQRVEILKALYRNVRILVLDEPTSNLTPQEVDRLFASLQAMVAEGMSIVLITHKIREVLEICDRMTVLRGGRNVVTIDRSEASEARLAQAMIGDASPSAAAGVDEISAEEQPPAAAPGVTGAAPVLSVEGVGAVGEGGVTVKGCSLSVGPGEVVGVAGVAGNGQRELAEAVMGLLPLTAGRILLDSDDVSGLGPKQLLSRGVAYVPEERHTEGILPGSTVAENLVLGHHRSARYRRGPFLDRAAVDAEARRLIDEFRINTRGPAAPGGELSGGNIQRVLLARALGMPPALLVAHNPTHGLDVGSVDFIHRRIRECSMRGTGTLLLSEDLDELMVLSHRIAVMYRGEVVGMLDRRDFHRYEIGRLMGGVVASG